MGITESTPPEYEPILREEEQDEEYGGYPLKKPAIASFYDFITFERVLLALLILANLCLTAGWFYSSHKTAVHLTSDRFFPEFGHQLVTFQRGSEYEHTIPSQEHSPWHDLLPKHSYGFVKVLNPKSYNLSGGLPLDVETNTPMPHRWRESGKPKDTEIYTISMFHQLHCLIMIRDSVMTVDENGKIIAGLNKPSDQISNDHLNHCFDYIRQAILCAGDTALDRYAWDDSGPTLLYSVNGLGTTHKCRNIDEIREFERKVGYMRSEGSTDEHH